MIIRFCLMAWPGLGLALSGSVKIVVLGTTFLIIGVFRFSLLMMTSTTVSLELSNYDEFPKLLRLLSFDVGLSQTPVYDLAL